MNPHSTVTIILIVFIETSLSVQNVDPVSVLPKLFDMESFSTCSPTHNKYCKLDITLEPKDATVREYIESTKSNHESFDRSVIYRRMCLSKESLKGKNVKINISGLNPNDFSSRISKITCMDVFPITKWDHIAPMLVLLVVFIQIIGTCYDFFQKGRKRDISNRYLLAFSLISHWTKLSEPKQNDDYTKLKFIQGIRVLIMCLVITGHTILGRYESLEQYEFFDMALKNTYFRILMVSVFFIIQINFLISSWVVASQINGIYKTNGFVSFKDVMVLILNRYFRFLPTLVFTLIVIKSGAVMNYINGPHNFHAITHFYNACDNNWLAVLLMANNIYSFHEMCHPVTWYLAVDTQAYIINLIILYIIFKYKWDTQKTLLTLLGLSCLIYGLIIYYTNLNVLFLAGPEFFKYEQLFHDIEFYRQYLSFYSNWSTSIIGLIFGTFYFKYKRAQLNTPIFSNAWLIASILLSIVPFTLSIINARSTPMVAAVLGAVIKPMFTTGIGIGLLGAIFSEKSRVKTIFERKFLVHMGNFVFSAYLIHFVVCLPKVFNIDAMTGVLGLIGAICFDIVVSFMIAIFITVLIEQPGFNLQKLLLPQIKYAQRKELSGNSKQN